MNTFITLGRPGKVVYDKQVEIPKNDIHLCKGCSQCAEVFHKSRRSGQLFTNVNQISCAALLSQTRSAYDTQYQDLLIHHILQTLTMLCSLSSLFLKIAPSPATSALLIPRLSLATSPMPSPVRATLAIVPTPTNIPSILTTADFGSCTVS